MRGSRSIELARLKKEEEERKKKNIWSVLRVPGLVPSRCFLTPLCVVGPYKLEDESRVICFNKPHTVHHIHDVD